MSDPVYSPQIDRRVTLKWIAAAIGSTSLAVACQDSGTGPVPAADLGIPKNIVGATYGGDPNLMDPAVTWERTMTEAQLQLAAALGDIILPESDGLPAASAVGVPDFIDEWVSSPYEMTQRGREHCFLLFDWLETAALKEFGASFAAASDQQKKSLLDRFAWRDTMEAGLDDIAAAFDTFRSLAVSAYFASAEGTEWVGYIGNQPMSGDYPGPSQAALDHLKSVLDPIGLTLPEGF